MEKLSRAAIPHLKCRIEVLWNRMSKVRKFGRSSTGELIKGCVTENTWVCKPVLSRSNFSGQNWQKIVCSVDAGFNKKDKKWN